MGNSSHAYRKDRWRLFFIFVVIQVERETVMTHVMNYKESNKNHINKTRLPLTLIRDLIAHTFEKTNYRLKKYKDKSIIIKKKMNFLLIGARVLQ